MAKNFRFELVIPERLLVSEMVRAVVLPSACGQMTVMVGHVLILAAIRPGLLAIELFSGESARYMVFKGLANIMPTCCTVLTESPSLLDDVAVCTLDQRIAAAQAELDDTDIQHYRSQLEQFLMDLAHLRSTISVD